MTHPFQKKREREREEKVGSENNKRKVDSLIWLGVWEIIFFYFVKDKTAEGNWYNTLRYFLCTFQKVLLPTPFLAEEIFALSICSVI